MACAQPTDHTTQQNTTKLFKKMSAVRDPTVRERQRERDTHTHTERAERQRETERYPSFGVSWL